MSTSAIIIPCYNRTDCLNRLLKSLNQANYEYEFDLVFSIDYSGKNDVLKVCKDFCWTHGNKRIITHKKNIGLRANILSCGDLLLSEYERIILLEDDLIVNDNFCSFAMKAAEFYEDNIEIGGISLYAYAKSEIGLFNFYPLKDEYDTYFMQWPSSWGQLWTRKQWTEFRNWLTLDYDFSTSNIPDYVKQWKNSWKKFYLAYLVETNRYFVYPYFTFTIESFSSGTHVNKNTISSIFNTNSFIGSKYRFRDFKSSIRFKYDAFFQPIDKLIKIDNETLKVSFDLYGVKKQDNISSDYVITCQKCTNALIKYGFVKFPLELNIEENISGNIFSLVRKVDFISKELTWRLKESLRIVFTGKDYFAIILNKIKQKFHF